MEKSTSSALRGAIYRMILSCHGLPVRVSDVHSALLRSGKWPDLTVGRVREQIRDMTNHNLLEVKQTGGINRYKIKRMEDKHAGINAETGPLPGA